MILRKRASDKNATTACCVIIVYCKEYRAVDMNPNKETTHQTVNAVSCVILYLHEKSDHDPHGLTATFQCTQINMSTKKSIGYMEILWTTVQTQAVK